MRFDPKDKLMVATVRGPDPGTRSIDTGAGVITIAEVVDKNRPLRESTDAGPPLIILSKPTIAMALTKATGNNLKQLPPQLQRRDADPWLNAIRPLAVKLERAEHADSIPVPGVDDALDKDKDTHMAEAVPGLSTPTESTVASSLGPSASAVRDAKVDKLEAAVAALTAKVENQSCEVAQRIDDVAKRVEDVAEGSQQLVKTLSNDTQNLMSTLAQNFATMLDAKFGSLAKRDSDAEASSRPTKILKEDDPTI